MTPTKRRTKFLPGRTYTYADLRQMPNGALLAMTCRRRLLLIRLTGNLPNDTRWKAQNVSTGRFIPLERHRDADYLLVTLHGDIPFQIRLPRGTATTIRTSPSLTTPEVDAARARLPQHLAVVRNRMPPAMECHVRRVLSSEGVKLQRWDRSNLGITCLVRSQYPAALDHAGLSIDDQGIEIFVGEPYASAHGIYEQAEAFAERFCLRLRVTEHSWHYPSLTVRFEFSLQQ